MRVDSCAAEGALDLNRAHNVSAGDGTLRLKFLRILMANDRPPTRFTDNFVRLLGLHGLSQHFTAQLLGVSEATMSAWMNGKSTPSLSKAIDIAELFQISTDRLMGAEFPDLLAHELADRDRFDRVETRIKRGKTKLTSV